jgi:hypothetical protein
MIIIVMMLIWNFTMFIEHPQTKIVSSIDRKSYGVKSRFRNKGRASNMLARLNYINSTLIAHLEKKYSSTHGNHDIEFLSNNYNGDALSEHTPRTTKNTSYVLNKGEAIKICLRDAKTKKFHDFNTIVFVNLHELSHLLDKKYGHNRSFWEGFEFILKEAVTLGLYTPVNYAKNPAVYCGITITTSPLFKKD